MDISNQWNKSDMALCILPIGTMLLLPYAFAKNGALASIVVLLIIGYLGIIQQKGYTLEILSVVLCIPALSGLEEGAVFRNFNYVKVLLPYVIFFIFFKQVIEKNISPFLLCLRKPAFLMLGITLLYSILYDDFAFTRANPFTYIFTTVCFFCIAYNDKIDLTLQRKTIDVLFLITGLYAIAQYFFNYSPYEFIYSHRIVYNIYAVFRAQGLLGHPLCLSCVCLLYLSYVLIRIYEQEKKMWPLLFFCCFVSFLTVSRTTVYVGCVEILLWLFLSGHIKRVKVIVISLLLITVVFLFSDSFLNDLISVNFNRIENGNSDHRIAGFKTIYNLLKSHWFGVGDGYMIYVRKEHLFSAGFIESFGTFDNYFLTQIAKYGLLAGFVFYFDYFLLIHVFKTPHLKMYIWNGVFLLFVVRSLMGFSFDVESYDCFNIPFFMFLSLMMKKADENLYNAYLISDNGSECSQ